MRLRILVTNRWVNVYPGLASRGGGGGGRGATGIVIGVQVARAGK